MVWLKNIIGKLKFLFTSDKVNSPLFEEDLMSLNLTTGNNAHFIREFLNSESLFIYPEKNNNHSQFCSCLDYLQDIDTGLMDTISNCQGTMYQKLISLFGILQALFVKHDAVKNLFESLDEQYEKGDNELKDIRSLRNLTIGHPTKKDRDNENKGVTKYSQIDIHSCSNLPHSFKFLTHTHDENKTPKSFSDYFDNCRKSHTINLLQEIEKQDRALTKKLKVLQQVIVEKENKLREESIPIISNIKKQLLEINNSLDNMKETPIDMLQKIENNLSCLDKVAHDNLNLWEYGSVHFRKQNILAIEQLKKIHKYGSSVCGVTDFCIFAAFLRNKCSSLNNTDRFLPYLISKLPVHVEQVMNENEGLNCFLFPLQVLKGHLESKHSTNADAQKIIELIIKLEQAIANKHMKATQDDTEIYLNYLQGSLNRLILDSEDLLQTLEKKCSICY